MQITLEQYELTNLIIDAVKMGVEQYLKTPKKDTISQRLAHHKFGKDHIDRWIECGFIKASRNGSKENSRKNFSYYELKMIANIHTGKEARRFIANPRKLHRITALHYHCERKYRQRGRQLLASALVRE